ncbi:23S rRNA methyltransferase [Aerococcus urinaehominis]|uniref:23S rRNA methyltransferase n=1 Tax=Aerococcus urinaehominis TaxID=128944 RepID=A0A0X8FK05_9LACT|nr:23S rRNA (uracil(1939)-C(5))-methyltransferase RlmD [Aerococcus urinaehominis]AMB98731.1 23S rRNA methyltransferase [Aerococcus urinaehominis]SDM00472.1 23S rRNA (uracil1939-C5)-methyltransferase [Aerococcus urinaehominis]
MARQDYPSEVLDVEIIGFDEKGMGQAVYYHPADKGPFGKKLKLSVRGALPGDLVRVTVPNAKGRKSAVVNYDEILKPSPSRIGQAEPGQPQAGGTPLAYMDYQAQLDYKTQYVKQCLSDQGHDESLVKDTLGMADPYHYRNKMELTFGLDGAIGMHEAGNFRHIIDMKDSLIAPEVMVAYKEAIADWAKDWQLPSYDKEGKSGLLRHLMLRKSFALDEEMVALFTTADVSEYQEAANDLTRRLANHFPNLASLTWIKNTDIADRTQAEEVIVLHGRDYIYDELAGYRYRLWFDTFFQPNPVQAEKMVDIALDLADVKTDMRVLDLFCGVGTFSLPFADAAKELAGIEIVETSIESAKRNAQENGLDNTYFLARDARKGMAEVEETWGQPDLLLLDPPRSGAGGKVMRRIGRLATDKVIYVSCNPKTMAQDINWLADFGYELVSVQPVDQFPHTLHVETVVLLTRSKATQ